MFPTDPDISPQIPCNENPWPPYGVGVSSVSGQHSAGNRCLVGAVVLVRIAARGFLVQRRAQAANHVLRNRIGAAMLVGFLANGYDAPKSPGLFQPIRSAPGPCAQYTHTA